MASPIATPTAVAASRAYALTTLALALVMAACGGGGDQVVLTLIAPKPAQELTAADDMNPDRPGVQVQIEGTSHGIAQGTTIDLFVDALKQAVSSKVETDGAIHIPDVTLAPGTHRIYLQTSTESEASDKDQTFSLKALVISSPDNAAELTEDEDGKRAGFQSSVKVTTYALAPNQEITLKVDKKAAAKAKTDVQGVAVFKGITLISGKHTLLAYAGSGASRIESGTVKVEVVQKCAVTFISPLPPESGADLELGGQDKCPATGDLPFSTDVVFSTDVGDGRSAKLSVNGQPVASAKVAGSIVTFRDVVLDKRASANTIKVELDTSNADSCVANFPAKIFIDCAGADCSITKPVPLAHLDANDAQTLFLNRSMLSDGGRGFDVEVTTDGDLAGQQVALIVDSDSQQPYVADAATAGKNAGATFLAVVLDEGKHFVQAKCKDLAGNVTYSTRYAWVVDTTACSVDITDPGKGTSFVPADDEDNASDGIQVVATASVRGEDCNDRRAAVCDAKAGITDAPFLSYDGSSPLLSPITLDSHEVGQTLCVEVKDHAGNSARDGVDVELHGQAPQLQIENPKDGAKYNAEGGGGYTKDVDPSSADACDASFSVACTELGKQVHLHHDSADGDVFAVADCKPPAPGSPALPAGYVGRAQLTAAFEDDDSSAVVVATQTVTSSSSQTIVGVSPALALSGDCRRPTLTFADDPCAVSASNQLSVNQAQSRDVTLLDASGDIVSATLTFSNTAGASGSPVASSLTSAQAAWGALDLGGEGTLTITATASDDFHNSAQISCTAAIVADLPLFNAFTAPVDNATFNPGSGCNTGNAGQFGVRVQAIADKQSDRSALVQVDGTTVASSVPIAVDGSIDVCVPVPDDSQHMPSAASSVLLKLSSTVGPGFAQQSRSVHVHELLLTDVMNDDVYVAADGCAGSGFGYEVTADIDAALNGATFTLSSGAHQLSDVISGGQITQCLALDQGPNTIVLGIDGSDVSYSVHVIVASVPPSTGLVIDDLAAPDPLDMNYRAGVTAKWPKPMPAWSGQLASYELRCAGTSLAMSADGATKTQWWNAATLVSLPSMLTPATINPSLQLGFRVEQPRHCALRALDIAGQPTPIVKSTDLTLKLRQQVLSNATTAVNLGFAVAGVGDIDGDTIDDLLVGGQGRAELFFGTQNGFSGSPDVVFVGSGGGVGSAVGGLGDWNHDGVGDFAITDSYLNGSRGRVSIFFGRPQAQWPKTPLNIGSTCNADLCLDHSDANTLLGLLATGSAGDFDADGVPDLAIGSQSYPNLSALGQLLVVLGGAYELRSCSSASDCRSIESCAGPGAKQCRLVAGETFWKLQFALPSGNWLDAPSGPIMARLRGFRLDSGTPKALGSALAALGSFDQSDGQDLAIGASGSKQVEYLSGRDYNAGVGFEPLTVADLGLRDGSGMPDGAPLAASSVVSFGQVVANLGNVFDVAGATAARDDLGIGGKQIDQMFVAPGDATAANDPGFSAANITIDGPSSNIGQSIASGGSPLFGLRGDLDHDGKADVLAATRLSKDIVLWYADQFAASVSGSTVQKASAISIHLAAETAQTAELTVEYVGDVNGDGEPDIVVGDWRANTNKGQIVLLY